MLKTSQDLVKKDLLYQIHAEITLEYSYNFYILINKFNYKAGIEIFFVGNL